MKIKEDKFRDVLFQKMGARWYIFSETKDGVIFSPLPEGVDPRRARLEFYEIIEQHLEKVSERRRSKCPPERQAV